jgi:hypothetical protein
MERNSPATFIRELDVMAREQVLALEADAHFAERPPEFQRIIFAKQSELATWSLGQ